MRVREIKIEITSHAVHRMQERACNPEDVRSFLLGTDVITFLENHQGFEITIPFKGRLVGDFDKDGTFIGKSFLLPPRFGKDYFVNGMKSRDGCMIRVSSVSIPGLDSISSNIIELSGGVDFAL